jgi:hypothetical protein
MQDRGGCCGLFKTTERRQARASHHNQHHDESVPVQACHHTTPFEFCKLMQIPTEKTLQNIARSHIYKTERTRHGQSVQVSVPGDDMLRADHARKTRDGLCLMNRFFISQFRQNAQRLAPISPLCRPRPQPPASSGACRMDRTERILDPIANYPSSCRDTETPAAQRTVAAPCPSY